MNREARQFVLFLGVIISFLTIVGVLIAIVLFPERPPAVTVIAPPVVIALTPEPAAIAVRTQAAINGKMLSTLSTMVSVQGTTVASRDLRTWASDQRTAEAIRP